jgi:hypothetical protein
MVKRLIVEIIQAVRLPIHIMQQILSTGGEKLELVQQQVQAVTTMVQEVLQGIISGMKNLSGALKSFSQNIQLTASSIAKLVAAAVWTKATSHAFIVALGDKAGLNAFRYDYNKAQLSGILRENVARELLGS